MTKQKPIFKEITGSYEDYQKVVMETIEENPGWTLTTLSVIEVADYMIFGSNMATINKNVKGYKCTFIFTEN